MKKLLILVAMAVMTSAAPLAMAMSADGTDGKIAFGVQGGGVWPNYSFKNTNVNTENVSGYMAGVYAEMGIWALTLRPEVNYVEKGYRLGGVAEVKNRYLELAALLKFTPFGASVVSPFILVGPSWSKHLSDKVTVLGAATTFNNQADRWDIAGVAGAGVEFNVAEHVALQLQARYNFGFRDIDRSSTEIKSRGLYGMGGLTFAL